jgi:hypothetical protein
LTWKQNKVDFIANRAVTLTTVVCLYSSIIKNKIHDSVYTLLPKINFTTCTTDLIID